VLYSRNPEKPRKISWNGQPLKNTLLGFCVVPQCPVLPLKKTPSKLYLKLPKFGPFDGFLESDDPFIKGLLNDEAMDGNGNNNKLPQA